MTDRRRTHISERLLAYNVSRIQRPSVITPPEGDRPLVPKVPKKIRAKKPPPFSTPLSALRPKFVCSDLTTYLSYTLTLIVTPAPQKPLRTMLFKTPTSNYPELQNLLKTLFKKRSGKNNVAEN